MKRFTFILFLFVFVMIPSVSVSAGEHEAVEKVIVRYFSSVKKYDTDKILSCYQPSGFRKPVTYWVDGEAVRYLKTVNKKNFTYKIKHIDFTEKKVYVSVRVKYYDSYYDIKDVWGYYFWVHVDDGIFDISDFCKRMTKNYKWRGKGDRSFVEQTIRITLVKRSGKWKIQERTQRMARMEDCGLTYYFPKVLSRIPFI